MLLTILGVLLAAEVLPAGAATLYLKDRRDFQGTIDEAASDDAVMVIRTADAVLKIPRAKIERIDTSDAATSATVSAGGAEQSLLQQAEADLAKDPLNATLRAKVDSLRQAVQSRARLNYEGLFQKLDVLISSKKFPEAIAEADQMIARITDEGARSQCSRLKAQAHIGLARRFHEFVNYPEEENNYKAAMAADPESPVAPLEMADMLQSSPARKADAINYYETGLKLAASHPGLINPDTQLDYLTRLAALYVSEKRFIDAGDIYLAVMRGDKNMRHGQADDLALNAYGKIALTGLAAAQRDHIIANTKAILAQKPRKQAAYLLLGHIYFDQKAWAAARDALKLAIETTEAATPATTVQEALYNLARCQHALHDNQEAVSTFQKLLTMRSDHYDALCELADILLEEAAYADALRAFEQALTVDKDKVRAHLGKGTTLQREGKFDDARSSFKEVLDRDKSNALAQLSIARAWFEEKKYDETVTEAEKTLQMIRDRYTDADDKATSATAVKPAPTATPVATPAAVNLALAATATSATAAANGATSKTLAGAGATSATLAANAKAAQAQAQAAAQAAATAQAKADEDKAVLAKATAEEKALMAEAYTLIGKCNLFSTPPKTNLAREKFGNALKFVERYAPAFEGMGLSFAADKLDAQAEENFNKAIAIDPQNPDFYFSFANYWMEPSRKKPASALPLYLKYQELGGKDPQVSARIKECGGTPKS